MDAAKIQMYLNSHSQYFTPDKIAVIGERMKDMDDSKLLQLNAVELKNPTTVFLMSLFFGTLGIDRFMIGDTGMGILKFLTFGLCSILWFLDLFVIGKKTKDVNFNKIMLLL